jgi:hypothetical protein
MLHCSIPVSAITLVWKQHCAPVQNLTKSAEGPLQYVLLDLDLCAAVSMWTSGSAGARGCWLRRCRCRHTCCCLKCAVLSLILHVRSTFFSQISRRNVECCHRIPSTWRFVCPRPGAIVRFWRPLRRVWQVCIVQVPSQHTNRELYARRRRICQLRHNGNFVSGCGLCCASERVVKQILQLPQTKQWRFCCFVLTCAVKSRYAWYCRSPWMRARRCSSAKVSCRQ